MNGTGALELKTTASLRSGELPAALLP